MRIALEDAELTELDVIVMHAPGTTLGDKSELNAVEAIFGKNQVHLINTKHQTGHTLGASGGLSMDLAIEMLNRQELISFPYKTEVESKRTTPETVMINAVGFGGNAVSIILQKV